jgi:diketogulonate reductase-like aldo/keto reductase
MQQKKLREYLHASKYDILVQAFCPLANGDPKILSDPLLVELASKYQRSVAQVSQRICPNPFSTNCHFIASFRTQIMIRFLLQSGLVVLPKSIRASRLAENLNVLDFYLSDRDMRVLQDADRKLRVCIPYIQVDGKQIIRDAAHAEYPFGDDDN